MYHRFWECSHLALFWKALHSELRAPVVIPPVSVGSQSALYVWILSWFAAASEEERAVMVQGVYELWLARNDTRDGKRIADAKRIARLVMAHLEERHAMHHKEAPRTTQNLKDPWRKPDCGWIKADVDGATSKSGDLAAGDVVFRDHEGAFRGGACQIFEHVSNPEVAELLACVLAVKLALEKNVQRLHIKIDCRSVVDMLNDPKKNLSSVGQVIQEVKEMLSDNPQV